MQLHVERPFHSVPRVQVAREIARPRELALAERTNRRLLLGELFELEFHGVVGVAPGTQKVLDEPELARIDAHAAGVVPDIAFVALNEMPLHEGRLEAAAVEVAGRVLLDAREQIGHDGLHVLLDLPLLFEDDLLHAREQAVEHQLDVVENGGGGDGRGQCVRVVRNDGDHWNVGDVGERGARKGAGSAERRVQSARRSEKIATLIEIKTLSAQRIHSFHITDCVYSSHAAH